MDNTRLADLTIQTSLDNSKVDASLAKLRNSLNNLDTAKAQAEWQQGWIKRAEAVNRAAMRIGSGGIRMGSVGAGVLHGVGQEMFRTMTSSLQRAVGGGMTIVSKSISDAMDAQAVNRKFDNVFQGIERRSEAFAKNLGKSLGRSPTELKRVMSRIQDSLIPAGFGREQAGKMSQELTKLAVDLATSESMSVGEASDRLVSGAVSGNHESLRVFGTLISDTSLNLQLMKDGIDGGIRKATEMEKILARLNMVAASTKDAKGTASRSNGSASFEINAMNSALTGLSETVGKAFVPSLGKLAKYSGETAKQIQKAFGDPDKFSASMAKWTDELLGKFDSLRDSASQWLEGIVKEWPKVDDVIGKHLSQLQEVSKYWDSITGKARAYADNPTGAVVEMGGQLLAANARTSYRTARKLIGHATGGKSEEAFQVADRLSGSNANPTGAARNADINKQRIPGTRAVAFAVTDFMHSALQTFTGIKAGSNAKAEYEKNSMGLDIKLPTWHDAAKQFNNAADKLSQAGDKLKDSVLTFLEDHKTSGGLEETNLRRQNRAREERRKATEESNSKIDMNTVGGIDPNGKSGMGSGTKSVGQKLPAAREAFRNDMSKAGPFEEAQNEAMKQNPKYASSVEKYNSAYESSPETSMDAYNEMIKIEQSMNKPDSYRKRENERKLREKRQSRQDELAESRREKIDGKTGGAASAAYGLGQWLGKAVSDPKSAIANTIVSAKQAGENAIAAMQQSPMSKSGIDWSSLTGIQDKVQSQLGGSNQNENKLLFAELKTFLGVDWLGKLAKEIEKLNAGTLT